MFLTDIILISCLLGFALAWTIRRTPWRPAVLLGSAIAGMGAGLISYLAPRGVALPLTVYLGLLLFLCATLSWRRPQSVQRGAGWRPVTGLAILVPGLLAMLPMLALTARVQFPEPMGEHPVGVRDGIVLDHTRGQSWDTMSEHPRKIMVRVWYPAVNARGFPRAPRWSRSQVGVAGEFFDLLGMGHLAFLSDGLANTVTHAYDRAPPATGSFPLLIFSHGYLGDVATNARLMAHLASLGYIVFSMTHPGESSAAIFPVAGYLPLSPKAGAALRDRGDYSARAGTRLAAIAKGDVQARRDYVDNDATREITRLRGPIWMDDFTAVLDAIASGSLDQAIRSVVSNADLGRIGYLGMSMGAKTGPAACQLDSRCSASAALDVGAAMPLLRNARSRVPVLVLSAGQPMRLGGQDFAYEPNATAGLDPRIHRITLAGATHWDFTDFALLVRPAVRAILPLTLFGTAAGDQLLQAQNRLIGDFFDTYLRGLERDFPQAALDAHSVARQDDLSALREWAR